MSVRFPDGFLWGAATAAYQIEGAVREDGRGESIWDRFSHTRGKIENGDTGDVACDHYHRWAEDVDLLAEVGISAYRFSLAWPRIQPDGRGRPNALGIAFYDRLVDRLLMRGVTPVVTLYHWDLPQALEDRGGWRVRETAHRFADYAEIVSQALGDRVQWWLTHNEPQVVAIVGHYQGRHAPGLRDLGAAVRVSHHLLLAHGLAVRAFRARQTPARIGIALNLSPVEAVTDREEDVRAATTADALGNRWYLDPLLRARYPEEAVDHLARLGVSMEHVESGDLDAIAQPIELLGVNYYRPLSVRADPRAELGWAEQDPGPDEPTTATGWPIRADGMEALLVRLSRDYPGIPLFVTENGIALREEPEPDAGVASTTRSGSTTCAATWQPSTGRSR